MQQALLSGLLVCSVYYGNADKRLQKAGGDVERCGHFSGGGCGGSGFYVLFLHATGRLILQNGRNLLRQSFLGCKVVGRETSRTTGWGSIIEMLMRRVL